MNPPHLNLILMNLIFWLQKPVSTHSHLPHFPHFSIECIQMDKIWKLSQRPNQYWISYPIKWPSKTQPDQNGNLKTYLPMTGLLLLWAGLGGGTGGCLAGTGWRRLGVAVVLLLTVAAGRVLGAGVGGKETLITVFGRLVVATVAAGTVVEAAVEVEDMDLAVLPEQMASFACPSFASWEEDNGLLGGSKGCLGAFSGTNSASELGRLPVEPV